MPPIRPEEEWWRHLDRPWVGLDGELGRRRLLLAATRERQADLELERARRRAVRLRSLRLVLIPLTLATVALLGNCGAAAPR